MELMTRLDLTHLPPASLPTFLLLASPPPPLTRISSTTEHPGLDLGIRLPLKHLGVCTGPTWMLAQNSTVSLQSDTIVNVYLKHHENRHVMLTRFLTRSWMHQIYKMTSTSTWSTGVVATSLVSGWLILFICGIHIVGESTDCAS